jgi:N12 class adenine-specific DNA methylase
MALNYLDKAAWDAGVYKDKGNDDDTQQDTSSEDSGYSASGILSAAKNFLEHPFQGMGTVIAPNYTPRPLDDSVYSDIPGTPVASGQFGELEDESVRDERMKDSADYMAANWPRLYGGVVAADEGLANVVGGIQNAVGGGNGILTNVQRAEEGMQNYRDQWNNEYGDSYFLNTNKFATDVGSGIGSTVPIMALSALMPGAAVAGGTRALTSALSRAGLGRLAMSEAGQALIADTVRSPISSLADSLSEYGTVVNDMMQDGMSEDEARRRAIPMFFKNMALDTFTVPLELGVMKGGKGIATGLLGRSAGEGMAKSIAKGAARTGMLAGASGLTEGYQEGAQNALENDVEGKRDGGWYNPFTWTNEDWESARGGFVGGALMGVPGNVAAGFHPEAKQAPLSAESQEQAQGIKDTLSHGKPAGMSNAAYNAYIELANSGNPDLIKQAASSLESFQQSQEGSQESTDDAATEAYKDYETYDQKQEIENFLDNNTVEQIGGEKNFNWLIGVLRNGTPEEVQHAYDTVIATEKATAEQEAKNRPARSGGSMAPNTDNEKINAIIQAANDSGEDPRKILAMAAVETGGGDVNAIGATSSNLMQIEDATADAYGVDKKYPQWKTDPYQNAMAGIEVLKAKTAEKGGDEWAGVEHYNAGGDPDYIPKVQAAYDSIGDIGGSGNVEAPSEAFYDLSEAMNPQVDGMDPNTMAKMNLLARDFYQKYGHRLLVTSLKRNGDGSSYHDEGHAFDFSDDFLEQNPDARDWLVQQGEKYGLKGLDEFSHPVETTDGGNVHFTDHGGPVPGGTSGAVTGKITSDDGQLDRELDQAAQEAKSDMDRIQAQSDQAMNEIMNDDSAEKTAQEAQEDAENAQKQAEESQQSTQDAVIPDVAQTIRDTSSNIDEINTLDDMFTKDGNGNDKFIDTPENRDYIKTNYKDEIDAAVKKAMQKTTAPKIKTQKKEDLPIVDGTSDVGPAARFMKSPHARLGNILADYDRNDPKFKGYMETFRHGTDEQQAQLADQLQQAQEQAKANSTTSNATVTTPSPANPSQQAVQAPKPAAQVNTPTPTQTAPKKAPKAQYKWGMRGYHWSGELNDKGKINIREADMSMYDGDMQFDVAKIQKAIAKAKTEEEARGIIRNIAKNTYGAHVERLRMKFGGNASVEEWRTKHKESPEIQEVYDDLTKGLTNLYEQATGKTLKEQFAEKAPTKAVEAPKEKPTTNNTETPKETPQKEKVEEKKGEVKHEENKGNNVNTKPQQAESKDTESADAEKGAESNVQKEVKETAKKPTTETKKEATSGEDDYHGFLDGKKEVVQKMIRSSLNIKHNPFGNAEGIITLKHTMEVMARSNGKHDIEVRNGKTYIDGTKVPKVAVEYYRYLRKQAEQQEQEAPKVHTSRIEPFRKVIDDLSHKLQTKELTPKQAQDKLKQVLMDAAHATYGTFDDMSLVKTDQQLTSEERTKVNSMVNDAMAVANKMSVEASRKRAEKKAQKETPEKFLKDHVIVTTIPDDKVKKEAPTREEADAASKEYSKRIDDLQDQYDHGKLTKDEVNAELDKIGKEERTDKRLDSTPHNWRHQDIESAIETMKQDIARVDKRRKEIMQRDGKLPNGWKLKEMPEKPVAETAPKVDNEEEDFKKAYDKMQEIAEEVQGKELTKNEIAGLRGRLNVAKGLYSSGRIVTDAYKNEMLDKYADSIIRDARTHMKEAKEGVGNDGQEQGKSNDANGRLESVEAETSEGNDSGKAGTIPGHDGQEAEGIRTSGNQSDSEGHAAGTVPARTGVGKDDSAGTGERGNKQSIPLTPAQAKPFAEETPGHDYTIGNKSQPKDEKSRYKQNAKAIKLLKQLEAEDRMPTPTEQKVLGEYNGWGGLKDAFKEGTPENKELRELLTDEEYKAAQASSLDAFYTPAPIVKAIWKGVKHLGFTHGRVLDPSMGTGNFFGNMPQSMRKDSQLYGVEMDNLTARFAKMLYPSAAVENAPFQRAVVGDNYFDLVISNIPFSQVKVQGYQIHNFFFANGIDKVRPGGLMVFITSQGSLTGRTDAARMRHYLAGEADLIGAFKLPSGTFTDAGTDVATDVVVFRKRDKDKQPSKYANSFVEIESGGLNMYNQYAVNEYFKKHEDNILGDYGTGRDQFGNTVMKVTKKADTDVAELLEKGFNRLPKDVYQPINRSNEPRFNPQIVNKKAVKEKTYRDGEYHIENGEIYQYQYDKDVKLDIAKTGKVAQRIKGYIAIKKDLNALYTAQRDVKATDKQLAILRKKLNKDYDAFVKKNGYLNDPLVTRAFIQDPDAGMVLALERNLQFAKKGNKKVLSHADKADVFTMRTMNPKVQITKADKPDDALIASLQNKGYVDMDYMSQLLGGEKPEVIAKALGSKIFKDPVTEDYVARDEYLSGNVREKYSQAVTAAVKDSTYQRNVDELKKVIPKDLVPEEIMVNLGSPWVPPSDVQAFVDSITNRGLDVEYYPTLAKWTVSGWDSSAQYRANGIEFSKLLEAVLNNKAITIYKGAKKDNVVDREATDAANATADRLREDFRRWLWSDKDRAKRLARYYNDNFNNTVLREYDGSHLTFPWINPEIALRPHQKDAVWRMLTSGNTLVAHCVGAGKTWEMQAAGMEMRRLGIANKPLYCVPNNVVKQFADEFRQLCPEAKLLVIKSGDDLPAVKKMTVEEKTEDGRKKKRKLRRDELTKEEQKKLDESRAARNRALARIQTEDWDGIIMSHTMFERLPVSLETKAKYIQQQLDILEQTVKEAKDGNMSKRDKSNLEARKETLKEKLNEALDDDIKDIGIPFEELGIDQIFVDEADLFKNLHYETSIGGVSGLTNSDANRSQDMFLKTQWLTETRNGRGVVFATGTPISNTIAELYTMSRYLVPKMLKEHGVNLFDSWIRTFAEIGTGIERKPSGDGFRKVNRVKNFINMAELTTMFRSFADIKTQDELHLNIPKLKNGKPTTIALDADPAIVNYIKTEVPKRIANIKANAFKMKKGADNMLSLTNDLRHTTMTDAKINACADNIADVFNKTTDVKGAQLVFCDYGIPKAENEKAKNNDTEDDAADDAEKENGEVYARLMQALRERGIPSDQIAFVQSAKNKDQQRELFEKVDNGEIRILIGSTSKMGAGTNCQHHLVALHDLDAPWRPRDLEQRHGRILRQGNLNDEVEIFNYVIKDSFDANMWEKLKNKASIIAQAMSKNTGVRVVEDADMVTLSYADVENAATGNPLIKKRLTIKGELTKLTNASRQFAYQVRDAEYDMESLPKKIEAAEHRVELIESDIKALKDTSGDNFVMKIMGHTYTKRKDATAALEKAAKKFKNTPTTIGEIGGLRINGWIPVSGVAKYQLVGNFSYDVLTGSVAGMENTLRALPRVLTDEKEHVDKLKARLSDDKKIVEQKNPYTEKLAKVTSELAAIDKAIENQLLEGGNATKETKPEDTQETKSNDETQYSVRDAGETITRTKEAVKAEMKEAFKTASNVLEDGDRMTFTMPNGSHIVVDLKNEILLTDKELAQAKKDHHIDDNGNVIVEGYAQLHGKDAYMALSQGSRENTGFHEAYHLAEGAVLTDREKSAIKKAIPDAEKRADKYAEWVEARKHGRGTAWGKLFQKIKDFAAKMKKIFTGAETVNDVFRQIESGEVWEQGARDNNERRYAIRQDDQEEAPVKPQDIIDAINDIVHIYEGSRLTDKERKELRESSKFDPDQKQAVRPQATDLYDRHAHAGFNRMGYFNLSNYGRILALHLDNVMKLKGNLELTNKVLDRQDKNAAENKMNGVNERLTPSQARQNAVMDFGAMMIRNPELARETYPAYAKIFDEGLEKHPDLKEKLDRVIQLNETYQGQTAAERAAGSIAREREKVQLRKHPKEWLSTHFDKFYTNWVDDKHAFAKVVARAEAELGRKLAYDYDVHKQAQMALNVASSRALLFLTGGKSTEDTYKVLNTVYGHAITKNVTMKDIMDALNKVSKEDVSKTGAENAYDALGNYLIAMRTEELEKHYHDAYARSAGFDEEGTREIIQNTPESIKKIAQMYWDINTNIVNILQQQGLISKDLAGKLRKYKHYCPMYRDMSDGITDMDEMIGTIGVFNKGGGYANVSNGIKRIEGGGKRPILDPITSLSQMAVSMISKCERNDVAKTFVKLGQDFAGLGDVVVRDPTLKHTDPTAFAFTVWQNGEQVVYRTTPEIYDALTNNDAQTNRFTIKMASSIAQTLRTGATISPSFIVRNLLRDTMSATVNSKTGFYLPFVDNIRGAWKLHFDKEFSAEYHASGASMSTYMRADADSSRDLTKELLGHKYDSYPVVVKQVRQLISYAWHKYEKFGNLIEDSTRAGEFRRARNQGLSIDQAGQLAREITLDFSRHGKKGQIVNKYVPFFNATIQGTDKFIRTFKDNPMRAILNTVICIILPSLGLWAINHDDDWYKELDENTKYTNWAIPLPGGTHLLIPKPQEVGILFGSGIEAVLNQMTGTDPHGMKEWARQYAEAMTPSLYPAVVRPLIEWMTNYSFWTGRNLVPASLQKAPSEMQFTSYTSELAKAIGDTWIAKSIKLSPIAIDNWISGWFGSAGRFIANMLNGPISYVRGNSRPPEPAKYWYEMPVIGSFIRQNGQNSEYVNRMYEIQKDMNDDYERSDAGKQRKGKKSSSNKPKELEQVDTAVSSVSKLNKEIKAIRNDPKKDPDRKRQEIDQRRTKINDLAKKVVLKFDK